MATATSKIWHIINEGAFAGIKTLGTLDDETKVRALALAEAGAKVFIASSVSSKIALGRICVKLKELVGDKGFIELVERYWCDGEKYDDIERELQYCQRMYKFSKRVGPRLNPAIPIDSYRKIMAHILKINTFTSQNKCIRKINETGEFNGIPVKNTKELRAALAKAKNQKDANTEKPEGKKKSDKNLKCPEVKDLQKCYSNLRQAVEILMADINDKWEKAGFTIAQGRAFQAMDKLVAMLDDRDWAIEYSASITIDDDARA